MSSIPLLFWTCLALCAFAANSILCRLALGRDLIDPATFTVVRLVSGAIVLALLIRFRRDRPKVLGGDWRSAIVLVAYAIPFSFAYRDLAAGTGALVLFGGVQVTMILGDVVRGRHPKRLEWIGLLLALAGLTTLVWPGLQAPDPTAAGLMAVAGIGWGIYSLRGRGSTDPLAVTSGNFWRAAVITASLLAPLVLVSSPETEGLLVALASGSVTSALGYIIWYHVLPDLGATRAAIAQSLVPLLAAMGGVAVLDESFTLRLFASGTVIAGGVAIATIRFGRASSDVSSSSR